MKEIIGQLELAKAFREEANNCSALHVGRKLSFANYAIDKTEQVLEGLIAECVLIHERLEALESENE